MAHCSTVRVLRRLCRELRKRHDITGGVAHGRLGCAIERGPSRKDTFAITKTVLNHIDVAHFDEQWNPRFLTGECRHVCRDAGVGLQHEFHAVANEDHEAERALVRHLHGFPELKCLHPEGQLILDILDEQYGGEFLQHVPVLV